MADFFKYEVLDECAKDMNEKGIDVPVYKGSHNAKAVMIVEAPAVSLNSTGENGDNVFVYYPQIRNKLLKSLAKSTYQQIKRASSDMTEKEWTEQIITIADRRLEKVLQHLGADTLPTFIVTEKDGVIHVDLKNCSKDTESSIDEEKQEEVLV